MKKNDIIISIGLLVYTYLFYEQSAGINFLLFNFIIIVLLYLKDKTLLKNPAWIAAATGCLLSSISIFIYGNSLSVFTNILSLIILGNYSINTSSSLIFASIHSSYTFVSALPYFIYRISQHPVKPEQNKNLGVKILIVLIPVIVTFIFILIYRSANPVFKNYTDQINLDFISWNWIRFVLLGWILLYALFNQIDIPFLRIKDEEGQDNLNKNQFIPSLTAPRINYENLSGTILFSLLNSLLFFLNIIDIDSIWITSNLPAGVTHSELVHQGVGMLIFSILIAIAIILFYFRGTLNFYNSNKAIKILAYLWILQNAILVLTTASKNNLYIENYSLTYKRIGVYVYLLLTLVGLITTFIKINQTKSNWFLFRKNAWIFYSVLVISLFINWDLLITKYNFKNVLVKSIDKRYLLSLSYSPIPDLIRSEIGHTSSSDTSIANEINYKASEFIKKNSSKDWQSINIEDNRVISELIDLNHQHLFTSIDLSHKEVANINPMSSFSETEKLNLSNTDFKNLNELSVFPKLKELDISKNRIHNLLSLPKLSNLHSLNISDNNLITDLSPVKNLPNLSEIDFSGTEVRNIDPLLSLKNLNKIKCNELSRQQYAQLLELNPYMEISVGNIYDTSINTADNINPTIQ